MCVRRAVATRGPVRRAPLSARPPVLACRPADREWFNAKAISKGGTGPPFVDYAYKDAALAHVAGLLAAAAPPFDGLFGFSQGGSLAAWVAALQQRGELSPPSAAPLRFVWLQSARAPRDPSCEGLFSPPLATPCFVAYNEDDTAVTPHETRALLAHLAAPTVVHRESGGHAPMSVQRRPADGEALRAWLQRFRTG